MAAETPENPSTLAEHPLVEMVMQVLETRIQISEGIVLTPANILLSIFILIIFQAFSKIFKRFLQNKVLHRFKLQESSEFLILKIAQYGVMVVGIWIVLNVIGFNLASLTVILGFLSVGIGFGLQNLTSNFVSGIILLFESPIKVGDWVELGELSGTVRAINLRSTGIETIDGVYIIVPNQDLITEKVINGSKGSPYIRIHTPIGVSYSSDMKVVFEVLQKVAKDHPKVRSYPSPEVRMIGFGDSSVDFDILSWIDRPVERFKVRADLYKEAWWALKEAGIEIPFPQRDLHLRSSAIGKLAGEQEVDTSVPEELEERKPSP